MIWFLSLINRLVNTAICYRAELRDNWQTPRETIIRRAGDCEDIAVLKMFLLAAWLPLESLRLCYAQLSKTEAHIFLVYIDQHNEWWVIDNRATSFWRSRHKIVPLDDTDYRVAYSVDLYRRVFDKNNIHLPDHPGITQWSDLLDRVGVAA